MYLVRSLTCVRFYLFIYFIFIYLNRESIRSVGTVGEYCRKKCLFYILYFIDIDIVLFKNNNNDVASSKEVNKKPKALVLYIYIYIY